MADFRDGGEKALKLVYKAQIGESSSTTIESRKFRIPSDLRRQPGFRPVSSKVGDHLRILLGVVVHSFLLPLMHNDIDIPLREETSIRMHEVICESVCVCFPFFDPLAGYPRL